MKKVICGAIVFLTGVLSTAILLAGSMGNSWNLNGQLSATWNLSRYGLMPALYAFIGIAIIGAVIAVWGVLEKKD